MVILSKSIKMHIWLTLKFWSFLILFLSINFWADYEGGKALSFEYYLLRPNKGLITNYFLDKNMNRLFSSTNTLKLPWCNYRFKYWFQTSWVGRVEQRWIVYRLCTHSTRMHPQIVTMHILSHVFVCDCCVQFLFQSNRLLTCATWAVSFSPHFIMGHVHFRWSSQTPVW